MAYKLKLKKALSYNGIVSATKLNPYVSAEDKATAEKAVATGYFEIIEEDTDECKGKKTKTVNGNKKVDKNVDYA